MSDSDEDILNLIKKKFSGLTKNIKKNVFEKKSLHKKEEMDTKKTGDFQIYIKTMESWWFPLKVNKSDLIISIKVAIEESIGISIDNQRLVYNESILNDDFNISMYDIEEKSTICMISLIKDEILVFLNVDEEYVPLILPNIGNVTNVKLKIAKVTGVPTDEQMLNMKGLDLENHWTMEECNIVENSFLNLITKNETMTDMNSIPLDTISTISNYQGICCVINNETFKDGNLQRIGTIKDENNIRHTFEFFGFEVQVYRDVSSDGIQVIFNDIKKKIKVSHRMFIMFVLSHGNIQGVTMTNGINLTVESIWRPFSNKFFPKLAGKPKLFFFVCCRGNKINEGVEAKYDSDVEFDDLIEVKVSCDSDVEYDDCYFPKTLYPSMRDLFLGYSTCPYYKSIRTRSMGTIYVNCLCKIIQQHPEWSISKIHQELQHLISQNTIKNTIKNTTSFQMPYHENMLRESAYIMGM